MRSNIIISGHFIQQVYDSQGIRWILSDGGIGVIEDTIYSKYYIVDSVEGYTLYHIVE